MLHIAHPPEITSLAMSSPRSSALLRCIWLTRAEHHDASAVSRFLSASRLRCKHFALRQASAQAICAALATSNELLHCFGSMRPPSISLKNVLLHQAPCAGGTCQLGGGLQHAAEQVDGAGPATLHSRPGVSGTSSATHRSAQWPRHHSSLGAQAAARRHQPWYRYHLGAALCCKTIVCIPGCDWPRPQNYGSACSWTSSQEQPFLLLWLCSPTFCVTCVCQVQSRSCTSTSASTRSKTQHALHPRAAPADCVAQSPRSINDLIRAY